MNSRKSFHREVKMMIAEGFTCQRYGFNVGADKFSLLTIENGKTSIMRLSEWTLISQSQKSHSDRLLGVIIVNSLIPKAFAIDLTPPFLKIELHCLELVGRRITGSTPIRPSFRCRFHFTPSSLFREKCYPLLQTLQTIFPQLSTLLLIMLSQSDSRCPDIIIHRFFSLSLASSAIQPSCWGVEFIRISRNPFLISGTGDSVSFSPCFRCDDLSWGSGFRERTLMKRVMVDQ